MRWIRLTLAAFLFFVAGACDDPVIPKYPAPEDSKGPPDEGDQQGFVHEVMDIRWV